MFYICKGLVKKNNIKTNKIQHMEGKSKFLFGGAIMDPFFILDISSEIKPKMYYNGIK